MQVNLIVSDINNDLIKAFENVTSLVSGIAEPIIIREEGDIDGSSKDTYQPAIICSGGECKDVFVDDDYMIGLYHRLSSKTYDTVANKGFGDSMKSICVANLSMICWGFKNCVSAEDFESIILANMPKDAKIVSTDFDRKRVFTAEFQGVNFYLPPNVFLFSINYKVQFEVKKSCLEINKIFNS